MNCDLELLPAFLIEVELTTALKDAAATYRTNLQVMAFDTSVTSSSANHVIMVSLFSIGFVPSPVVRTLGFVRFASGSFATFGRISLSSL